MGSPFTLIFYAADSLRAKNHADSAFALVDSLNKVFSDYLQTSELNRLSLSAGSGQAFPVSPHLLHLLQTSKEAAAKSRGSFNITIGPLSQLWRKARQDKRFPSGGEVAAANARVGLHFLTIDTNQKTATLSQPGMQLDLGGIAKGYVAQVVVQYLAAAGITSALADAGGDIACTKAPPGKEGWTVGINQPQNAGRLLPQTIALHNGAVATSGDLYQYLEHEGRRYSHIIDPRSGYGVSYQRNVTVIAADGATADWLATACSILPLRQCKKLVRQTGAALLITYLKGGRVKTFMTKSMKKRFSGKG